MTGPAPAVAAVRVAVRRALRDLPPGLVLVACSGGADSLALAAATAFEVSGSGRSAGAVVVDHGLQPDSAGIAARAAAQCAGLGLAPAEVVRVEVGRDAGPEAAARQARYAALGAAAARSGAVAVLLGHTRQDQAEQVLLALVRGSGARSLAGMPRVRPPLVRPLLGVSRETTRAACRAEGLTWWDDPHNEDPAYLRVRVRRLLAEAEERIGPGLVVGLARTADLLREDADLLDDLAAAARAELGPSPVAVSGLAVLSGALRTRVWRLLAVEAGAPAGALSAAHVSALDALLTDWHGQGAVDLPGGIQGMRTGGQVRLGPHPVE